MVLSWLITLVLPLQSATNVSLKSSSCSITKKHHRTEGTSYTTPAVRRVGFICYKNNYHHHIQVYNLRKAESFQPHEILRHIRRSAEQTSSNIPPKPQWQSKSKDYIFSFPFHRSSAVTAHTAERNISLHVASLTIVLYYVIQDFDTRQKKQKKQYNANSTVKSNDMTWLVACCERIYVCAHAHNVCVWAASHRPRMLVGPVWCQRSVLSGRHSGLSAWR